MGHKIVPHPFDDWLNSMLEIAERRNDLYRLSTDEFLDVLGKLKRAGFNVLEFENRYNAISPPGEDNTAYLPMSLALHSKLCHLRTLLDNDPVGIIRAGYDHMVTIYDGIYNFSDFKQLKPATKIPIKTPCPLEQMVTTMYYNRNQNTQPIYDCDSCGQVFYVDRLREYSKRFWENGKKTD